MNRLLAVIKNKYLLVTALFIVWIFFFAQYDVVSQFNQRRELRDMQQKIDYLEKEVSRLQQEKQALQHNPEILEKYAREKYYMKRKNEDVYVFDTVRKNTP
ncbi:MAG: septum formation initiator family protein [Chitinophagaceae bacterium]|nr:septum formation initiator family protein [Chitinophagaceae bacterium]